jgi:hypothetical protein
VFRGKGGEVFHHLVFKAGEMRLLKNFELDLANYQHDWPSLVRRYSV